ncbi:MAG: glycosyltransferase family 2 protein [Bacteroidaceae bacterium]
MKISIIVPVYKAEGTIRRCLDSLRNQTYTDWEAILVDDGSPDASGEICESYKAFDSRFRVLHKENGGASSARNVALGMAIGQFVTFMDSDDYAGPNWLQDFASHIDGCDVTVVGFVRHQGEEAQIVSMGEGAYSPAESMEQLSRINCFGYLWNKCFRRSIIREQGLAFNKDYVFLEDEEFVCRYWLYAKKVRFVSSAQYQYISSDVDQKYGRVNNYGLYVSLLENASRLLEGRKDSVSLKKYANGCFYSMMKYYADGIYHEGYAAMQHLTTYAKRYKGYCRHLQWFSPWNYIFWHPVLITYQWMKRMCGLN